MQQSGEADRLSARSYNLALTGLLAYGLLLNAVIVYYFAYPLMNALQGVSPWVLLLGYLVPTLAGIVMAAKSQNPVVSFIGYNLVVLPIGIMLALVVPGVPAGIVVKAMALTGMVTLTMALLAIVRPQVFLGLGRTLLIALVVGIVFLLIFTASTVIVSFEGHDLVTTFTAVAATINNIGPGLSLVGPTSNYAFLSGLSKWVLIFDMLAGRLELFPLIIFLTPMTYKGAFKGLFAKKQN